MRSQSSEIGGPYQRYGPPEMQNGETYLRVQFTFELSKINGGTYLLLLPKRRDVAVVEGKGGHDGAYALSDPHRTRATIPGFIPATCHHLWAASLRASAGINQAFLPKWWDVSVMEGKGA